MRRLWQEEEGRDLVEHGLLVAWIALVAIAAMGKLANGIIVVFGNASGNL